MTVYALMCALTVVAAVIGGSEADSTGKCMDNDLHKSEPGPESYLHSQCSQFQNYSCCTEQTSRNIHHNPALPAHDTAPLYSFNYSHCGRHLSAKCQSWFQVDHCQYECSPYLYPWFQPTPHMKTRRTRFKHAPLCASDCRSWYEQCQSELTCADNWMTGFVWGEGGNKCPAGAQCRTFKQVWGDAVNFCERVWDHSWKVVDDDDKAAKPCLTLYHVKNWKHAPEKRRYSRKHNADVATYYYNKYTHVQSGACTTPIAYTLAAILTVMHVMLAGA